MSQTPTTTSLRVVMDAFAPIARRFVGDDLLALDSARVPYAEVLSLHSALIDLIAATPCVAVLDDPRATGADRLAQEIRRVDGGHTLGAGALADALWPFIADLMQRQGEPVAWHAEKTGRSNWSGNVKTSIGLSLEYPKAAADEGYTVRPLIFGDTTPTGGASR